MCRGVAGAISALLFRLQRGLLFAALLTQASNKAGNACAVVGAETGQVFSNRRVADQGYDIVPSLASTDCFFFDTFAAHLNLG